MIYLKLIISFFQIGLFSIGGGYAALPLIQNQVVELNKWMTMTEYTDMITISGMCPGPIAINASTFVGMQVGGMPGAIAATFGCVLPSSIIVLLLGYLYRKFRNLQLVQGILNGLRPAVTALIASAGISILILTFWGNKGITLKPSDLNIISLFLFAISLYVIRKYKANPIYVMFGSGLLGLIIYAVQRVL
ncbi:chromate transporter [Anaerocolumna sp. AGMB13025]|uniref:chromate transporter n=1 Tax=Anaerocolumna sp. AGMB13025 TaxID=3039116 RepID=UPI00241BFAC2|nr:chromate transporter [Anaerocolumna sp. AGMB13025]WFR55979.1 chromate transporter [Anaerocolumna sp. AGMB13025]